MKFIYTRHAEENLLERKIPKSLVEYTIKNPDAILESYFGRNIAHKLINNKLLRVIYSRSNGVFIIITAYYMHVDRYKVRK